MSGPKNMAARRPEIVPLGDSAVVVRFGTSLDDEANRAALALAAKLQNAGLTGVREVVPSLVSVLVRYDPLGIGAVRLAGEIGLFMGPDEMVGQAKIHDIAVRFDGPDVAEVAAALNLTVEAFIARHNASPLRVLTTGFAPGFVYCGLHPKDMTLPRRSQVRSVVPAGSVLFAAGQTAIAATDIPTGWHVIGNTEFRNFAVDRDPPTELRAGDLVRFRVSP